LQLELPREAAPAQPQAGAETRRPRTHAARLRWLARAAIALAAIGGVGAIAILWVLPWYVRRQCIEEAAAHGITLEVDSAQLDTSGFRLLGVRATAAAVPDARAQAPEIEVETSGLHPEKMTVRQAELLLRGPASAMDAALSRWRASPAGGQGGAWMPAVLVLDESRIAWQSPVGEGVELQAAGAHLEIVWHPQATELHARSDRVTLGVPGGTLGPWRMDVDRTSKTAASDEHETLRVRVALDPGVPEACTVLVVGNEERTTSVDVVVPRSPIARLGIPPELLGLRGGALQLEANAHYVALGPQRSDVTAKGALYSIEVGLPQPLDVSWDGTATGDPHAGIDLKKARLAVGPLAGALAGTLKTYDDGFRLDLAWSAGPVPCRAFDTPPSGAAPIDLAYELRKLAEAAGVTDVRGDVSARGSLAFDTRDLSTAHVSFTPDVRCQVALFGR
jgi:hypothetical protein